MRGDGQVQGQHILAGMIGIGARIAHPKYGEGAIFGESGAAWRIFFQEHGEKELAKTYESYEVVEPAPEISGGIDLEDVITAVENVFDQYMESPEPIDLGDKWEGGVMELRPGEEGLKSCLLYTSPSPRDATLSRMPSSA